VHVDDAAILLDPRVETLSEPISCGCRKCGVLRSCMAGVVQKFDEDRGGFEGADTGGVNRKGGRKKAGSKNGRSRWKDTASLHLTAESFHH
jgi:hypothetical protein